MLAASVALLALVASVLTAGRSYFYCAPMARAALVPCCERDAPRVGSEPAGSSIDEATPACCEARAFASSASFVRADAPPAIAAPLVALAPARVEVPAPPPGPIARLRTGPIRAGPPPALARAVLQVWNS